MTTEKRCKGFNSSDVCQDARVGAGRGPSEVEVAPSAMRFLSELCLFHGSCSCVTCLLAIPPRTCCGGGQHPAPAVQWPHGMAMTSAWFISAVRKQFGVLAVAFCSFLWSSSSCCWLLPPAALHNMPACELPPLAWAAAPRALGC